LEELDMTHSSEFGLTPGKILGVKQINRFIYSDERGTFSRIGCLRSFQAMGLHEKYIQFNLSTNKQAGTIRGLHGQRNPYQEAKFVTCLSGSVVDVIVDNRQDSSTYLQHEMYFLNSPDRSLVVPEGCLHGFQTLEDNTIVCYGVTAEYSPSHEIGMNPLDPAIGISWPMQVSNISTKDSQRPFINVV
jgi:dTDP-4-dehydrorhamnose 3,5-epimerase